MDTSGLYYYGARYYLPELAHFTQPDPLLQNAYDPQTLNHYSYCRNNPLNLIDPSGMSWRDTWNSWSNSWSSTWNSWSNSLNNIWSSWRDTVSNLRSTFTSFTQTTTQAFNNLSNSVYSVAQTAMKEAGIWGNAFSMGVNYGLGQMGQGSAWLGQQALNAVTADPNSYWGHFWSSTYNSFNDPVFKTTWRTEFNEHRMPAAISFFSAFPFPIATATGIGISQGLSGAENFAKTQSFKSVTTISGARNSVYFSGVPNAMRWGQVSAAAKTLSVYVNYATAFATGADIGTAVYAYWEAHKRYQRGE